MFLKEISEKRKVSPALQQIPIERLKRGRYQPRQNFNKEALAELADSIKSAGLLQPLIVRLESTGYYEIIAGERRWRAAQLARLQNIPCLVVHYTDEQAAQAAAVENLHRVDLNPIEQAAMCQKLLEEFDYTHEELAILLGKNRSAITNALRLLKMDERVQFLLKEGQLCEAHGKILAGLPVESQYAVAKKSADNNWSSRQLEREVKRLGKQETQHILRKDHNINALERALSEHLGCPASIKMKGSSSNGQLKIDFYNLDVLESLFEKIGFMPEI